MRSVLSRRPRPAMIVAFVALVAALSGTAVALPGKNTVDSGDIKKGAVKRADLGKNAVNSRKVGNGTLTGADVKNDRLTGADINEGTLAQVPSANSANTANLATDIAAPEAYREVGTPGNPSFGTGCSHAVLPASPDVLEKVAFYKDREGVVHLRGAVTCTPASASGTTAFQLPPGYRPRSGRIQIFHNVSSGAGSTDGADGFIIAGTGVPPVGMTSLPDGGVVVVAETQILDGTTFRAES